jgi:predicted amidohydrolase YtcJ
VTLLLIELNLNLLCYIVRCVVQNLRLRIEHAQIVSPSDIAKFHDLGVIASMQPRHATSDMLYALDRLGPDRIRGAYAWKSFLSAGVHLAFGSDFPIEPPDPMLGFYSAVSRKTLDGQSPDGGVDGWTPHEKLSRYETLVAFTREAAYAAFQEEYLGSIKVGKLADFVILDRNILEVEEMDIPKTQILKTFLSGKIVYEAL